MTVANAESLRAAVVTVGARWSSGQRELVRAVAALDASNEWVLDGAVTCAHWVAEALDVEVSTARDWLRVGRRLQVLAKIDARFAAGELSYSKVRALTRLGTPDNEDELCAIARDVPAGRLAHALAQWQMRHETPQQTEARQDAKRHVTFRDDPDGMVAGWFRLPPGDGAVLKSAIESVLTVRAQAGASADASESGAARWPSFAQQRADALVELVTAGGMHASTEIVLHVRGDGCSLDESKRTLVEELWLRCTPCHHDEHAQPNGSA